MKTPVVSNEILFRRKVAVANDVVTFQLVVDYQNGLRAAEGHYALPHPSEPSGCGVVQVTCCAEGLMESLSTHWGLHDTLAVVVHEFMEYYLTTTGIALTPLYGSKRYQYTRRTFLLEHSTSFSDACDVVGAAISQIIVDLASHHLGKDKPLKPSSQENVRKAKKNERKKSRK